MRACLALLLAAATFAVLAPPAHAQTLPGEQPLSLELDAWEAPAVPLATATTTSFRVSVACTLLVGRPAGTPVDVAVADAPAWATVVVSPPAFVARVEECRNGRVGFDGRLIATANDQAPADLPQAVRLRAQTTTATNEPVAREAESVLTASYFGILDVAAETTIRQAAPGERVVFPIAVTNHGNGEARVEFRALAPPGLDVPPIAHLTLMSRQQGASTTSFTVELLATAPREPGAHTILVWVNSTYAHDPQQGRTHDAVSLQVVVDRSAIDAGAEARLLPLEPHGGILALVAAAALARRLRGRHV